MSRQAKLVLLLISSLLLIDQAIKFYVKTHYHLGEYTLPLGANWCQIRFVENIGMAFGVEFGNSWGKIALGVFRLAAVGGLAVYLRNLLREGADLTYICLMAMVWAGAFGNILDGTFYGMFFSESGATAVASFLPAGGGYAGFMHGKVVDMFYFPLWSGTLPTWLPFWGGQDSEFFRFIFNFADASISVGMFLIIVRYLFSAAPPAPSAA